MTRQARVRAIRSRLRGRGQRGYALLLVFLMASTIALMLYMQLPREAFESERDKEQMLIDRGERYKRAIYLYYISNNRQWPARIEDLESTNNHRYLARRYVDPYTGKDDWRIIHTNGVYLTDSLVTPPPAQANPGALQGGALAGTGPATGGTFASTSTQPGTNNANVPPQVNAQVQRRPSDRLPVQASGFQNPPPGFPGNGDPNNQQFNSNALPPISLYPNGYNNAPANVPGASVPGAQGQTQTGVTPPGLPGQSGFNQFGIVQPGVNQNGVSQNGLTPIQTGVPGFTIPGTSSPVTNPGIAPPTVTGANFGQPGVSQPVFNNGLNQNNFNQSGFDSSGINQPGVTQPGFNQPGVNQAGTTQPTFNQPVFNPGFQQNPNSPGYIPGQTTPGVTATAPGNQAVGLINQLLTTPRQPPTGIGGTQPQTGGGIAGVASKYKGATIKSYGDREKYQEWEFVFQVSQLTSLQPPGAASQAGQGQAGSNGFPSGGPLGNSGAIGSTGAGTGIGNTGTGTSGIGTSGIGTSGTSGSTSFGGATPFGLGR